MDSFQEISIKSLKRNKERVFIDSHFININNTEHQRTLNVYKENRYNIHIKTNPSMFVENLKKNQINYKTVKIQKIISAYVDRELKKISEEHMGISS